MKSFFENRNRTDITTIVIVLLVIVAILFLGRSYYIRWIDNLFYPDSDVDSHLFSEELVDFSSDISESIPTGVELKMARVEHDERTVNIYFEYVDSLGKANIIINLIHEYLSQNPDCIIYDYDTNITMFTSGSYERTVSMQLSNNSHGQRMWRAEINEVIIDTNDEITDDVIVEMVQVITITGNETDSSKIDLLRLMFPRAEIEL